MSRPTQPKHPVAPLVLATAVIACWLPALAQAQTCASPLPLIETPAAQPVDTCQTPDSLPMLGGFFPSPHNDAVFYFVVGPGMSGTIAITANFPAAAMLMPSPCGPDTPLQFAESTPTQFAIEGLPTGMHFLVLTGDPKLPLPVCGTAAVTANAVFTDVIFADGFQ
jgi:hypothetical protein